MKSNPLGLSRGWFYRLVLGAVGLVAAWLTSAALVLFWTAMPPARDWQGVLLQVLAGEFLLTVCLLSLGAVVWSVWAPAWLERFLERQAWFVSLAFQLAIPGFLLFLWLC